MSQQQQCAALLEDAFPGAPGNKDVRTRAFLLLEEAIELAQAAGVPLGKAVELSMHVYSRPAGELSQEIAGVGITTLMLCEAVGESLYVLVEREMESFARRIPQIREKSKHKVKL